MFHIVDFVSEGVTEVVPVSWVVGGRSYWPPYDTRERCDRAVIKMETPGASWQTYSVKVRATRGMP